CREHQAQANESMLRKYHETSNQYSGLKEGGQTQANDLLHPLDESVNEAPGDGEHVQAANRDLDEQDPSPFQIGEEYLEHSICHQDDAENEHDGIGAQAPDAGSGDIGQGSVLHVLQYGSAELADTGTRP